MPRTQIQAGTDIPPPAPGQVFPWLAERTWLTQLVAAAVSWLNLTVIVTLKNADGTVSSTMVRPVITNKNATLTLPIDLTNLTPGTPGSGGGGSLTELTFVSDGGDYIVCNPGAVHIQKPYKLRTSIASETINGVTYSYAYAAQAVGGVTMWYQRTVTYSGLTEVQQVLPFYLAGDKIYAVGTQDVNADGRAWSEI